MQLALAFAQRLLGALPLRDLAEKHQGPVRVVVAEGFRGYLHIDDGAIQPDELLLDSRHAPLVFPKLAHSLLHQRLAIGMNPLQDRSGQELVRGLGAEGCHRGRVEVPDAAPRLYEDRLGCGLHHQAEPLFALDQRPLDLFLLRNVGDHGEHSEERPSAIGHRRGSHADLKARPVLVDARRVDRAEVLTGHVSFPELCPADSHLVRVNGVGEGPTDEFLRRPAINALGGPIPELNAPFTIQNDDACRRGLDDRFQFLLGLPQFLFHRFAFGDVTNDGLPELDSIYIDRPGAGLDREDRPVVAAMPGLDRSPVRLALRGRLSLRFGLVALPQVAEAHPQQILAAAAVGRSGAGVGLDDRALRVAEEDDVVGVVAQVVEMPYQGAAFHFGLIGLLVEPQPLVTPQHAQTKTRGRDQRRQPERENGGLLAQRDLRVLQVHLRYYGPRSCRDLAHRGQHRYPPVAPPLHRPAALELGLCSRRKGYLPRRALSAVLAAPDIGQWQVARSLPPQQQNIPVPARSRPGLDDRI